MEQSPYLYISFSCLTSLLFFLYDQNGRSQYQKYKHISNFLKLFLKNFNRPSFNKCIDNQKRGLKKEYLGYISCERNRN